MGGAVWRRIVGYVVGLALSLLLTATSFFITGTDLVGGTVWIMGHLNANMPPMDQIMQMRH